MQKNKNILDSVVAVIHKNKHNAGGNNENLCTPGLNVFVSEALNAGRVSSPHHVAPPPTTPLIKVANCCLKNERRLYQLAVVFIV